MGSFLSILDPLRDGLYHLLLAFQGVVAPLVGSHSAWLAIVALTVTVRIMLLPLALTQWRDNRAMQAPAPEVRALRPRPGTALVMLLPLALTQWRAPRAMQALAPAVRELQRQHADDPSRLRS